MRQDTVRLSIPKGGAAMAAAALLLALAGPAQAQRDDPGLQLGCANDYFRLCAGVDPNSPEADRCMNRNRPRLSPECRKAISDYDRKTAPGPRGSAAPQDAD